ncbi:hypothetical protein G8C92_03310 [Paenibacillus donghaensis]|uniref:hypothetical protein n=1 Tax=Paenibacillus donghaensis TaxID=414771 RepID=UPI001883F164|nr:hypothetical protein [Paenibacillus donghaensis]
MFTAGAAGTGWGGTFGSWDTTPERRRFAGAVNHFLECISHPERCSIRADLGL